MGGLLDDLSAKVELSIDVKSATILGIAVFLGMLLAIMLGATIVKHQGN